MQNALKKLLKFGKVANFVGYDALNDFFPTYTLRPNPECDNRQCRAAVARLASAQAKIEEPAEVSMAAPVVHEDGNDWGIEVEDEEEPDAEQKRAQLHQQLRGAGLEQKYDATKEKVARQDLVKLDIDETVDDLSAAFAALN